MSKGLKSDLVGFPAISSLKLIQSVCSTCVMKRVMSLSKSFLISLKGLGTLGMSV